MSTLVNTDILVEELNKNPGTENTREQHIEQEFVDAINHSAEVEVTREMQRAAETARVKAAAGSDIMSKISAEATRGAAIAGALDGVGYSLGSEQLNEIQTQSWVQADLDAGGSITEKGKHQPFDGPRSERPINERGASPSSSLAQKDIPLSERPIRS